MDKSKFAIIFGCDNEKNNTHDGEILHRGDAVTGELHIKSIIDFINEYYSDDPVLTQLNVRHQPTIAAYFLVQMGHIVFLNSTEFTKESLERYGKNGILFLPNVVTEKQIESLKKMAEEIPDYDILIKSNLEINDGFLQSKTLSSMEKITPGILEKTVRNNVDVKEEITRKI